MIHHLEELSEKHDDSFGGEVAKLIALEKSKMNVVKTLILTTSMFKSFSLQGTVDSKYIDRILNSLDDVAFLESSHLFIQTSLIEPCSGIQNNLKAEKNYSSVKYQIEKIYRSWADEKARAYRLTHSVSEDASMPTIFIQPYFSDMVSLVSRTSTTGEKTNEENYKFNVHNKIPVFHQSYKSLLDKVELVIKSPSKIYLSAKTRSSLINTRDGVTASIFLRNTQPLNLMGYL